MANIRIDLDHPIRNGETICFKAPCDCNAVEGLIVYYPSVDGVEIENQTFVFKDSHGNDLTGLGELFCANALVAVLANVTDASAHVINADTNKYLETKLTEAGKALTVSDAVDSDSSITVASSKAVKTAYDAAVAAKITLSDSTSSSSSTTAASSKAVKTAYDRANTAYNLANDASTYASQAANSATTATNKATAAANSATSASSSASSASTSATNASNSATSAANSASTATSKASAAETAAAQASRSATNAADDADRAEAAAAALDAIPEPMDRGSVTIGGSFISNSLAV